MVYIISLKDFNLTERREGISIIAVCYTPYFVLLLFQKGNLAKVLSVRFLQISVGKHSNSVNLWRLLCLANSTRPKRQCGFRQLFLQKTAVNNRRVWFGAATLLENGRQTEESMDLCSFSSSTMKLGECGLATLPENSQQIGQCEFRQLHVWKTAVKGR